MNGEPAYGIKLADGTFASLTAATEEGLMEIMSEMFGVSTARMAKEFATHNWTVVEVVITEKIAA